MNRHKVQHLMFDPSTPPDLGTKSGRKAWRHELRMVAVRPRRWGLWLLTAGFLALLMPSAFDIHALFGVSPSLIGIVMMAAALPFLIAGSVLRRRYVRGRIGNGGHI